MTIDNTVDSVSYNGYVLQVEGNMNDWKKEKTFKFSSCYNNNPGELIINGTDSDKSEHCLRGGMMLLCAAADQTSPWHNFGSDLDNWVDNANNSTICSDEGSGSFVYNGLENNVQIIEDLHNKGAKKIWVDNNVASLRGTPKNSA